MYSSAQTTLVSELQVFAPVFRSYLRHKMSMQTADDYQVVGGVTGGKKIRSTGAASIAAAAYNADRRHPGTPLLGISQGRIGIHDHPRRERDYEPDQLRLGRGASRMTNSVS